MKSAISLVALALASTNVMAGEWDYPAGNNQASDATQAQQYLRTHYPSVGELSLRYQTSSLLGRQYNFDIYRGGEYQPQRTLVLHTDKQGLVTRVYKSLTDTMIRQGEAVKEAAIEIPRRLIADAPPELSDGELVTRTVNVVDPDLRSMDKQPAPETLWTTLADYPHAPRFVIRDVSLLDVGGTLYLSNPRVQAVDAIAFEDKKPESGQWQKSDSVSFLNPDGVTQFTSHASLTALPFDSQDFAQMMAFYHLDKSLQYVSSLGYSLFDGPVRFDAHALSSNNSSYYVGPNAVMFGASGSPDTLDADVVVHELAHGIHYHILPDWAYGHTGALGEGFADYWAGSASYHILYQQGDDFEIDTVFNWDGYFGFKQGTRSLWNQKARYFESSEYRAHENVGGELGDELWSTPLFQTLKQAVALYGEPAFKEMDTLVLESMFGLGRGMKMHDLAESMLYVAKTYYPSRDYAALLKANFEQHGLLKAPFHFEISQRYVADTAAIHTRLTPQGRTAKVRGDIKVEGGAPMSINQTLSQVQSFSIPLPLAAQCGQPLTLEARIDYQFDDTLQTHQWQDSLTVIKGLPQLTQSRQTLNATLPDVSVASNGAQNNGFKSFNFIINDDTNAIRSDLGVYVHINHASPSDLRVVLVSPAGTRVTLHANTAHQSDDLVRYWTSQHDGLLQAFDGEPLAGNWRLEVTDYAQGSRGELLAWQVGRVTEFDCQDTGLSTKDVLDSASSGGGALSWPLLLVGLLWGGWRARKGESR